MVRLRRSILIALAVTALSVVSLSAQQARAGGAAPPPAPPGQNPNLAPPEAGTAAISGVVIDGATKVPLAGAVVYLGPPQHGPPDTPVRTLTDSRGRYVFRNLPAFGSYFIQASKFGYFNASYGRGSSGALGGRVALADGQWFSDGNITMWRPSAISGRVVDHHGEPVVGVYVRLMTRVMIAGRAQVAGGAVTTTDDRGVYRIGGLQPGSYLVQVPSVQSSVPSDVVITPQQTAAIEEGRPVASRDPVMEASGARLNIGTYTTPLAPINGRTAVYPPTFHPNVTAVAEARAIDLDRSDERTGVDIQLSAVPSYTLAGTVDGPVDSLANLTLRLMPVGLEDLGTGSEAATVLLGKDGKFTALNVPAGAYTVIASRATTEYQFRDLASQTKSLPRPPVPSTIVGWSMSSFGVLAGPAGTSMTSVQYINQADTYVARMPLTVGGDRSDVVVPLKRLPSMTGRLVWPDDERRPTAAAGMPPSEASLIRARLFPAGGQASLGLPQTAPVTSAQPASDQFVIQGLGPGEYVLSLTGPGGGRVKSITWKGRDYTNTPFDASSGEDITDVVVTMTAKTLALSGTVLNERGLPDDAAAVIVFPAESNQWSNYGLQPDRVKAIATTNTGTYRFQSLPAGEYLAVAVTAELIDGWKDPSFLLKASRAATRLTLSWGDNKTQDLRVSVVK